MELCSAHPRAAYAPKNPIDLQHSTAGPAGAAAVVVVAFAAGMAPSRVFAAKLLSAAAMVGKAALGQRHAHPGQRHARVGVTDVALGGSRGLSGTCQGHKDDVHKQAHPSLQLWQPIGIAMQHHHLHL